MPEQQTVEVVAAGQLALAGRESVVLPDDVVSGEGAGVDREVETRVGRRPGNILGVKCNNVLN